MAKEANMKNPMTCGGLVLVVLLVVSCFGSNLIKGSVVMRTDSEAHIVLGSDDEIQVGDTLTVWRQEHSGATTRTVPVGTVRAIRILDEGHSAVEVVRGSIRERDLVEKKVQ